MIRTVVITITTTTTTTTTTVIDDNNNNNNIQKEQLFNNSNNFYPIPPRHQVTQRELNIQVRNKIFRSVHVPSRHRGVH